MTVRVHHVLRIGECPATAGISRRERTIAESDRCVAAGRSVYPIIGRWIVRDHTDTIAQLCGPWGRP